MDYLLFHLSCLSNFTLILFFHCITFSLLFVLFACQEKKYFLLCPLFVILFEVSSLLYWSLIMSLLFCQSLSFEEVNPSPTTTTQTNIILSLCLQIFMVCVCGLLGIHSSHRQLPVSLLDQKLKSNSPLKLYLSELFWCYIIRFHPQSFL